jgi:hypothetical protein
VYRFLSWNELGDEWTTAARIDKSRGLSAEAIEWKTKS